MKRYPFLLFMAVFLVLCVSFATSENTAADRISAGEEWSWDPGAYNTFEGSIDLYEYTGRDISVEMSTDLVYDTKTEQSSMPVFTIVNGKRIVMLKQTNTIRCLPDEANPVLRFSGRIRLPEKQHTSQITFQFCLKDENGEELKTVACRIDDGNDAARSAGSSFYIRFRTETVTLILAIAAAAVWSVAVIRFLRIRKQKRTGE